MPMQTDLTSKNNIDLLREDIKDLAPLKDMEDKSEAEEKRAEATKQLMSEEMTKEMIREGEEKRGIGREIFKFGDSVGDITARMKNESDRIEKDDSSSLEEKLNESGMVEEDINESLGKRINEFDERIVSLIGEFKDTFPERVIRLSEKYPDTKELGEEVSKIINFMKSLNDIKVSVDRSWEIKQKLPIDIMKPIEKIMHKSLEMLEDGDKEIVEAQKLRSLNPERVKKLNEIVANAEKNLEPFQRTVGKDFSRESARIMNANDSRSTIGDEQVNEAIQIIKDNPTEKLSPQAEESIEGRRKDIENIYTNKVVDRVRGNMEKQGRTQEEIQKKIDETKQTIDNAIKQEQEKTTQTTTTPSPYTAPQA